MIILAKKIFATGSKLYEDIFQVWVYPATYMHSRQMAP